MKTKKSGGISKGPLSASNMRDIESWHTSLDVIDIAQRLNRSPKQVEKYLKEYLAHAPKIVAKRSQTEEIRRELKSSAFWSSTKEQFTDKELIFYENSYIDYRLQLTDVTAVEIKQIHILITLDIYMFRHNQERKSVQEEIERLEKFLEKEHKRDYATLDNDEKSLIVHSETQLAAYKSTSASKTKEYKDLLDKHTDILKSLKSTRDQRIKTLEDRGKFINLLHELEMNSRRKSISESVALAEMAAQKEYERLSKPYSYDDGMIDNPILNHETNSTDYE